MAVARMLRVDALGHRSALEDTVDRLQRLGAVQVTLDEDVAQHTDITDESRRHEIEELAARAEFVTEFLGRFHESDQAFGTFVSEKFHLSESEFRSLEYDSDFDDLYRECEQLAGRLADIARERERLTELGHALQPWKDLHLQLSSWKGTERVRLFAGTLATARAPEVRQELREAVSELSIEEVSTDGPRQAWIVMVIPEHEDDVRDVLARTDFEEASFPGLVDYPAEEIALVRESLDEYEVDEAAARERAQTLSEESYHVAVSLGEALRSRWLAQTVRDDFGSTRRTFSLSGWMPAEGVDDLENAFADLPGVDIAYAEPTEDDDPPVMLANPRWLKPFEVVTDLYGRPRYGELDPTAALSVWFFFFFGLCLGDVGYGIVLVAIAYLIKHKLDVGPGVRRFMDLLVYGGVASAIVGVFTGSYFALDMELLPGFLRSLVILDPLRDVSEMLILSIVLGVVHVLWGVVIRTWDLFRNGEVVEALADEVSTLLMWLSAALLVGGLMGTAWLTPVGSVGLVAVVLLKGRVIFPPYGLSTLIGPLKGVFGVYNTLVGHIADFLSYTRLAALGMATILVGQVMNIVAELVMDSVQIAALGLALAALIFVIGHVFNLAISLLGAFVHTLRLQFVEFFGKFYSGGGTVFAPFDYGTQSLVLRREPVQKEGG